MHLQEFWYNKDILKYNNSDLDFSAQVHLAIKCYCLQTKPGSRIIENMFMMLTEVLKSKHQFDNGFVKVQLRYHHYNPHYTI